MTAPEPGGLAGAYQDDDRLVACAASFIETEHWGRPRYPADFECYGCGKPRSCSPGEEPCCGRGSRPRRVPSPAARAHP